MTSQKDLEKYLIKVEEGLIELADSGYVRCGPFLLDEDYLKENHYEVWCKVMLNV